MLAQPVISLIDFLGHIFSGFVHQTFLRKILREITVILLRDGVEQIVVVIGKAGIGLKLADAVAFHNGGDGDTVERQALVTTQILYRSLHAVEGVNVFCKPAALPCGDRFQLLISTDVVPNLLQCAHTAQAADEAVQRPDEADRLGSDGALRVLLHEHLFDCLRHLRKPTALDRLHDDDLLSVLADDFIAGLGLHKLRVPVHVVCRNLDKLKFGMLGQNTIQELCRGMEGKAKMFDLALRLPLERMLDQMLGLNDTAVSVIPVVPACLEIVEQSSLWETGSDFVFSTGNSSFPTVCPADPTPNREARKRRKQNDLEVMTMRTLISCKYHEDSRTVELLYTDGTLIDIYCMALEDEVGRNMFDRSELDYLLTHDPVGYADLILDGNVEEYLQSVTDYRPLVERKY